MNFYAFSALFIAFTTLILGIIVYTKNKKGAVNKAFSYFAICVFFWSVAYYFWQISRDANSALFYCRLLMAGAIFVPVTYLHFVLVLIKKADKKSNFLAISYFLFFIFLLTDLTPLFVNRVEPLLNFPFWPRPGIAFHLFLSMWFVYVCYTTYLLYTAYKNLIGLARNQVKYVLWGFIIGFIAGSSNYFLWYKIPIPPILNILGSVYVAGMAYSIIRYRLMDIRLVISRSLLYLILVSFVTAIFVFLNFFTVSLFNDVLAVNAIITTFFVSLIVVLTLEPLKRYIAKNTDYIFYRGRIDYQAVLKNLSEITSLEIDLGNLVGSVTQALTKVLKLKKALLFLPNKTTGGFTAYAADKNDGQTVRLKKNHPLLVYLKKTQDLVVTEELEREVTDLAEGVEKNRLEIILNEFRDSKIGLLAPVFVEGEMKSILMLGEKLSGDIFNKDDLALLELFSPQLGTALEKAKLYQEVKDFSIKLKEEVKKATSDLSVANEELSERNRFLQTLHNITTLITRTLDLKKVTQSIVDGISKELGYVGGILLLIDKAKDWLYVEAITQTPLTQKAMKLLPRPAKEYGDVLSKATTLSAKAAKTGQNQISRSFSDFISPPVPRTAVNLIQKLLGIRTVAGVPVFSENEVVGVILFGLNKEEAEISEMDFNMMKSLANQTGIIFKNLELYEQIRLTNEQLKFANSQLRQLDQAKSEFMSIASHQLRTPLSGIMGYLSMILEGDFGGLSSEMTRIMREIFEASQRLIRMVNLFLNVTRIEAGRFKLNLEKVDIIKVIQEQIKTLKPTAEKKNLKLEFASPKEKIPLLNLDQDKIKDVVLNLVDNAIKYTKKGSITVSIEKKEKSVLVSVKDTGVGIKPADAEKLFGKFVRGSGISRLSPDGSGLGLFIARKIVDAHQGKIWAESKGEGLGSTMRFELPAV